MSDFYLTPGDEIRIISTARSVESTDIQHAKSIFESWGYQVSLGENLFKVLNQFAGSVKERVQDLQNAIDAPNVKAIFAAKGGYGSVQIVDLVQFKNILGNRKPIIGFSDVTVLHSHIHRHVGTPTLHAPMPCTFKNTTENAMQSLKNKLQGGKTLLKIAPNEKNRVGEASGVLVGGNLSILYSLLGSNSDIDTDGKLLFIEDLDEYLYHLDRMMINMKRNGKLSKIKGLLVGGFTEMNDNVVPYGENAQEIITKYTEEYDYPVVFGFPAGHVENNFPIVLGEMAKIEVYSDQVVFTQ